MYVILYTLELQCLMNIQYIGTHLTGPLWDLLLRCSEGVTKGMGICGGWLLWQAALMYPYSTHSLLAGSLFTQYIPSSKHKLGPIIFIHYGTSNVYIL